MNIARIRQRITARVHKAFDQILLAKADLTLIKQILVRTEESVVISRARFRSGKGQYIDVLRTRIASQNLQNILREAELVLARAYNRLNLLMGRPADFPLNVNGELAFQPWRKTPGAIVTEAEEKGPTFKLLQKRIEQANLAYRLQRKNRAPEITLGLGRQRLYDGSTTDYAWAGQVSLKFPFPGSNRQRGLEQEAQARSQATHYRVKAILDRARARLRQRAEEANALAVQLTTYQRQTLPDVDDQLKAARQAYRVRRIDNLNLMDVYRTYLETRRNYLTLLVRHRAARIDILTFGEDMWEIGS